MPTCIASGWGTGVWGQDPWAGPIGGAPGGPIPSYPPNYDIYCVGPCGQMLYFDSYDEVQTFGVTGQFSVDLVSENFIIKSDSTTTSGGVIQTARVYIDVGVPEDWTSEFTLKLDQLPTTFNNLADEHLFIGSVDATGSSAGLFISSSGIAYTGSVWYDLLGKLHVNSAMQVLPDSVVLLTVGEYYTFRMAVDDGNGVAYIYITKTSELPLTGHVLRYVLPAVSSSTSVHAMPDGTYISCCGTSTTAVRFEIDTICMGTGLVIPNLPPVADAGRDQSARMCSIVRLDGRASFDPEGSTLKYQWRLIDAPIVSSFIFETTDGVTLPPPPATYTNRLYSEELGEYDVDSAMVSVGDVITFAGESYFITGKGVDINGYYVVIDSYALPANRTKLPFKMLKQNGISTPTGAQPTFYPDVTGIFKFDLVVFDGSLYSQPSITIINVVESVVPRGCIPDLSFLWNYISDFWQLVENKEHIETFWGALAQIAATELLSLWQVEYNKSLRDIQRTFQRRWLHYDLRVLDLRKEDSSTRYIYGGVYLKSIPVTGATVGGQTILISSPVLTEDVELMFYGTTLTDTEIVTQLSNRLKVVDDRFTVTKLSSNPALLLSQIRIEAPFPFTVYGGTATDLLPDLPANNSEPSGIGALVAGIDTVIVDRDLGDLDIQEDDLLVLNGEAYRISRVISKAATDDWANQRLVLKDPAPSSAPSTWYIVGGTTSAFLDYYNALLSLDDPAVYEVTDTTTGQHTQVMVRVLGASAAIVDKLAVDAWPLARYLYDPDRYTVSFVWAHRRTHMPVDPLVVSVPILQEKIKDSPDEEILRENVDYFVEEYRGQKCLRFMTGSPDVWQGGTPPDRMWAEMTYIDNRPVIEANFGIPAEFTLDDLEQVGTNLDYLSAVRGMWYSFFYGPTIRNLRVGTQILLGLPFAEEEGTIEEIRNDFSMQQGRILVRDVANKEIVRSYTYPKVLDVEVNPSTGELYKVGDVVSQFSPLVEGVEVVDYVKDPLWFRGYLNQGVFYEVEKFFRFLVRVDSAAFNLSSLLFVKSFINKIKPTYTFPKFVVRYNVNEDGDAVDVTDVVETKGTLLLHDDISARGLGHWMHIDDPNQAGGGWMGRLDSGRQFTPDAVHPDPQHPVVWAVDKSDLVPQDSVYCVAGGYMDGIAMPSLDSFWALDNPVQFGLQFVSDQASVDHLPVVGQVDDPIAIGEEYTAAGSYTLTNYCVEIAAIGPNAEDVTVEFWCTVNGVVQLGSVQSATLGAGLSRWNLSFLSDPVTWNAGDVVRWFIRAFAGEAEVAFYKLLIKVGESYLWAIDVAPPAGSYTAERLM